jgi:hypothetical protein
MPPFPLVPTRYVARSRRIWRMPPVTLTTTPQLPLPPNPPLCSSIAPPPAQRARDENRPTDGMREPHGYLMYKDHVVLGQSIKELGRGHRRCVDSSDVPRRH